MKNIHIFSNILKSTACFSIAMRSEKFPSFLFMQLLKFIYQGNTQKSNCLSLRPWILHENCIIHMFTLLSKATCVAIYLIYCNLLILYKKWSYRGNYLEEKTKPKMKKENSFVNFDKTITSLLVIKHSKHNCLLWFINNIFSHSFFFKIWEMNSDFTFSANVYLVLN